MGKKISPNSKRRERRHASTQRRLKRSYEQIRQDKGVKEAAKWKNEILQKAKERYEKAHEHTKMIREKLSRGEMNQAIRFLYDKGVIKGMFDYYEDFLEQHQDEWTKEEVEELLEAYIKEQDEGFKQTIDILKGGTRYVPTKSRCSNGYTIDFV